MPVFGNRLDNLIDQLEAATPHVNDGFTWGFAVERHDWRSVWGLCKQIQSEFKGYKGYNSREEHQAAWERFQRLRRRASELADIEKKQFAAQSEQIKVGILSEAKACYYSMSADAFVGSIIGQTTAEDMKRLQSRLKDAGRKLSENKRLMTRADKEECFQEIKRARESHDRFWEKYKQLKQEGHDEKQKRRETFERKRSAWMERVKTNIQNNRDKRERAIDALVRTRKRIKEHEHKLSETKSQKWIEIFSDWISVDHKKERDIEESIERIEGWIREEEDKLNNS